MQCLGCKEEKRIRSRGLCAACYHIDREAASLDKKKKECTGCKKIKLIRYSYTGLCNTCYHSKIDQEKRQNNSGVCAHCHLEKYIKYRSYSLCTPCYQKLRNVGELPPKVKQPLNIKIGVRQKKECQEKVDQMSTCHPYRLEHKDGLCLSCYKSLMAERRKSRRIRDKRKARGFKNPTSETKSGNCESCKRYKESLHLDHCHVTGATRGWLCFSCNVALGHVSDSIKILENLITYMRKYTTK